MPRKSIENNKRPFRFGKLPLAAAVAIIISVPAVALSGLNTQDPLGNDWGIDLSAKFHDYHLQILDRDAIVEDAEDGLVTLTLFTDTAQPKTFQLAVREKPMIFELFSEETGQQVIPEYPPRFFEGTVVGEPDHEVVFTAVDEGIDGFIETDSGSIWFEPLTYFEGKQATPNQPGLTVVFNTNDLIFTQADWTNDSVNGLIPDDTLPPVGGDEPIVGKHTNRVFSVGIDSQFYNAYGSGRAATLGSLLDSIWHAENGWHIHHIRTIFCNTTTCDSNHGLGSTAAGTLLQQRANHIAGDPTNHPHDFDTDHTLTGKNLNGGTIGIALLPGRYGVTQVRNEGIYDGGSSNYEASIVVAHETGHNYDATHDSSSSSHDHGFMHCHLSLLGICLDEHWHSDWYTHWTIMSASVRHEPSSKWEQLDEFSTFSRNQIHICNDNPSFSTTSYAYTNAVC